MRNPAYQKFAVRQEKERKARESLPPEPKIAPSDWITIDNREASNSYDAWTEYLCISGKTMAICANQILGEFQEDKETPEAIDHLPVVKTERGWHLGPLAIVEGQRTTIDTFDANGINEALSRLGWQSAETVIHAIRQAKR